MSEPPDSAHARHLPGFQRDDISLNLFPVLIVETKELDSKPKSFSDIAHSRDSYDAVLVRQFKPHNHSGS